jgi:hypothetical protein
LRKLCPALGFVSGLGRINGRQQPLAITVQSQRILWRDNELRPLIGRFTQQW